MPPGKKREMEEKEKKQEEAGRKDKEREDRQRRKAEEEQNKQQEAADRERQKKLEEKQAKKAEKERAKEEAKAKGMPAKKDKKQDVEGLSEERIREFAEKCSALVDGGAAEKVEALAEDVSDILTEKELETVTPIGHLLDILLRHCRLKEDDFVIEAVQRFAPLLSALIKAADVHRFKVKVLCEAQRIAHEMGLPRLSPASALIEVFFDALYRAEIVEEEYFEWWSISADDTPGKTSAMFQINPFLDWLREGKFEGESSSSDGEDGSDGSSSGAESDDGDVDNEYTKRAAYR